MESAADALSTSTRRGAGLSLVVAVVALSVGAIAQQQATPPSGAAGAIAPAPATAPAADNHTAVIRGRVLRADIGRPLAFARVSASNGASERAVAVTDDSGRFELRGLRAGRYTVLATRTGYVTFSYGQRRSSEAGRSIEVGIAQTVNGIELSLPRGGVITGTVVDQYGEPLVGAPVEVMRPRFVNGVRRMVSMGPLTGADLTDDRGHFRVHGLEAGTYYVAAGPGVQVRGRIGELLPWNDLCRRSASHSARGRAGAERDFVHSEARTTRGYSRHDSSVGWHSRAQRPRLERVR